MILFKVLKNIDIFGQPVNFNIRKNDHFQTILGGILSLVVIGAFIFQFFPLINEFFDRKNPLSYVTKDFLGNNETFNLESNNDLFKISLFDQLEEKMLDIEDFFFLDFLYLKNGRDILPTKKSKKSRNITKFPLSKSSCNITDNNFTYCPDFSKSANKGKIGYNQENGFYTLQLKFCKSNETKEKICKNYEDTLKKLENDDIRYLIIFEYKSVFFTPEDFKEPIRYINQKKLIPLTFMKTNFLEVRLRDYISESDDDKILGEASQESTIGCSKVDYYYSHQWTNRKKEEKPNGMFNKYLTFLFLADRLKIKMVRRYLKIFDVIGESAVLASWIYAFFGFFYSYYISFKLDCYLFNNLVRNVEMKIPKKADVRRKAIQLMDLSNKNTSSISNKQNANRIIPINSNAKKDLKLNLIENPQEDSINDIIEKPQIPKNEKFNLDANIENIDNNIEEDTENAIKKTYSHLAYKNDQSFETFKEKETVIKYSNECFNSYTKKQNQKFFSYTIHFFYNLSRSLLSVFKSKETNDTNANMEKLKGSRFNEHRLIDQFSEIVKKKLDLFYYFKMIKYMSLIKNFMFSKNRKKLINFISDKQYPLSKLEKKEEKKTIDQFEFTELVNSLEESNAIDKEILEEIYSHLN